MIAQRGCIAGLCFCTPCLFISEWIERDWSSMLSLFQQAGSPAVGKQLIRPMNCQFRP